MIRQKIFTGIVLVILYLIATFVLDNSVIWLQVPIHLILASVVAFLIFKKDSKPLKKGLVFSLIILVAMNITNYFIVSITPGTGISSPYMLGGLLGTIENPITYALIFLISFNIPFIVKHFISKKQEHATNNN